MVKEERRPIKARDLEHLDDITFGTYEDPHSGKTVRRIVKKDGWSNVKVGPRKKRTSKINPIIKQRPDLMLKPILSWQDQQDVLRARQSLYPTEAAFLKSFNYDIGHTNKLTYPKQWIQYPGNYDLDPFFTEDGISLDGNEKMPRPAYYDEKNKRRRQEVSAELSRLGIRKFQPSVKGLERKMKRRVRNNDNATSAMAAAEAAKRIKRERLT